MDKQLKELDFEGKIPTSFTEKDKQKVLTKIKDVEPRRKNKYHYFPKLLTAVVLTGLIFVGFVVGSHSFENGEGNAEGPIVKEDQDQHAQEKMEEDEQKKEKLKVGAYVNRDEPDLNYSNYNLYMAHLRSAIITGNGIYGNGRTPMDEVVFREYLESISTYLTKIEYSGEKEDVLLKTIELTNKAIENSTQKGDQTLDDIHAMIHELAEYFNTNPFVDDKTNERGVQFFD